MAASTAKPGTTGAACSAISHTASQPSTSSAGMSSPASGSDIGGDEPRQVHVGSRAENRDESHRACLPPVPGPRRGRRPGAGCHRRTGRSLTRSSAAITADGTRCSNLLAASSRTSSRRLRPSAVSPPPCAYRMHPAYRHKPRASAQQTRPTKISDGQKYVAKYVTPRILGWPQGGTVGSAALAHALKAQTCQAALTVGESRVTGRRSR